MKVRYEYRLRPGATARRYLAREWDLCRFVWNEMVAQSKAVHEARVPALLAGATAPTFGAAQADKFLTHLRATCTDQDGTKWLAQGSSVAQQQTVRDFCAARAQALADITTPSTSTRRAGMPRFRKRSVALPTMNYTRRGFTLRNHDGALRLVLPGKISIPVVWSRSLPAQPSSVRVHQDSLGHWYASFVVEQTYQPLPEPPHERALGVDWGVREVATTAVVDTATGTIDETTTYDMPHKGYRARAQGELARRQRAMARRKTAPGHQASAGYLRAKRSTAKVHAKIARQRKDDARKWARKIVVDHARIAVEDFRPRFLSRTTMAAKAADGAIATAKSELIWQAIKTGRDLRLVNPAHTTMDCAHCGARATHRLPLGQRTYTCKTCGYTRPRDKNSAAVMVARAGFVPADADRTRPRPPQADRAA